MGTVKEGGVLMSQLQKEARKHNWNKAMLKCSLANVQRMLNNDIKLSMGSRAHLTKAYKRLNVALERW